MRGARSSIRDDQDKLKDSLAKVKAENRKLRKEISQLRREKQKNTEEILEREIEEESKSELANELKPLLEEVTTTYCPTCRADSIVEIPAGMYLIRKCQGCGYKNRKLV